MVDHTAHPALHRLPGFPALYRPQVRRVFARHGEVAAVEWRWSGGILRLLVSFKVRGVVEVAVEVVEVVVHPLQEKVVEGLVGSTVEVFKEKVVVREVTGFTMMD